jgi:hypothetical protein
VGSWNLKESIGYGYDLGKAIVGISILSPLGYTGGAAWRDKSFRGMQARTSTSRKMGNLQHSTTLLEFCTAYVLNRRSRSPRSRHHSQEAFHICCVPELRTLCTIPDEVSSLHAGILARI